MPMEELGEPTLVQSLRAHRGDVSCIDVFGAWLVSSGGDRTLRLWRWTAGVGWQEVAAAPGAHRYGVTATRWSSAGTIFASAGVDGIVRVWCGRSLVVRRVLAAPGAAAVRALCWAGGARLLAGHDDGALCVWCVQRGSLVARLHAHEGALHAVCTPARGALLLTACTHGVLKVFDLAEICESGSSEGPAPTPLLWVDCAHDLGALCADATEDGAEAATGGHDGVVRVWRVGEVGEARVRVMGAGRMLEGHGAAVTSLRWAVRTPRAILASASLDRTARLWEPAAGACLRVICGHARYLTCVVLAPDLKYLITGSNDKSVRTWSLGEFSLTEELEPACVALAHFALGDLEGIGPVETEEAEDGVESERGGEEEAVVVGEVPHAHAGAVNCVAVHGDLLATASSDGLVKIFRWYSEESEVKEEHTLEGHQYPVLAVEFGAGGRVLLTAGLDGTACVWDVQTGVQLRSFYVPTVLGSAAGGGSAGGAGEVGGGGVRGARVSPHRPPLLLLATDDGLAALWSLTSASAAPSHVYAGHTEAVTCCAWCPDGRAVATGSASGELRLHTPPPAPVTLHHESAAHDLGVQSCDFASSCSALALPDRMYLLATGGSDSLIKLWILELTETEDSASVSMVRQWEAHGGGVTSVRWGSNTCGALLASAGADRWARVWRVSDAGASVVAHAAVHVESGALAVALLQGSDEESVPPEHGPVLTVGTFGGALALWRVPAVEPPDHGDDEGAAPRWWGEAGVARWLQEYVTRPPGSTMSRDNETTLLQRARDLCVTGVVLLDEPLERLLSDLGYGEECELADDNMERTKGELERGATRNCLRNELEWLRREPPPPHLVSTAPHGWLCPLTHALLREPARAADGFTYERAAILEWFLGAGGAVSPVSGRRMRNARVLPNYALRDILRSYLEELQAPP